MCLDQLVDRLKPHFAPPELRSFPEVTDYKHFVPNGTDVVQGTSSNQTGR